MASDTPNPLADAFHQLRTDVPAAGQGTGPVHAEVRKPDLDLGHAGLALAEQLPFNLGRALELIIGAHITGNMAMLENARVHLKREIVRASDHD